MACLSLLLLVNGCLGTGRSIASAVSAAASSGHNNAISGDDSAISGVGDGDGGGMAQSCLASLQRSRELFRPTFATVFLLFSQF